MFKNILVPLDGSQLAESAIPCATSVAACTGATVTLLRVVTLPVAAYPQVAEPWLALKSLDAPEAEALCLRFAAIDYVKAIAARLESQGVKVSWQVRSGSTAETIENHAKVMQVDLIVMSTHGRGGLARMVMGSVADQIVRGSHFPILLVRP